MKIEVLMSSMYLKDLSFLKDAGIVSDLLIINQTTFDNFPNLHVNDIGLKVVSNEDRGLSNSRNVALSNAKGDICLFADDDVFYVNNYERIVRESFLEFPEADIILFDMVDQEGQRKRKKIRKKDGKLNILQILRGNSVRISIKRESVLKKSVLFNKFFGSGSNVFIASEDLVFLVDCYRSGLKIYYVSKEIVGLNDRGESTWFKGYNAAYFETIGAFARHYWRNGWFLYVLQFLARHPACLKTMSIRNAIKSAYEGVKKYKQLLEK